MKKIILSAVAVAVLVSLGVFASTARSQNANSEQLPHKVGLIDMAHVFKEYKKFKALREDLKFEIEASDRKAKAMAVQAQNIQKQLREGVFKEGTPEFKKLETQLIQLKTQFEAFRAQAQREFLRKESQIYKTVYLEVADTVDQYAVAYHYTLILRFNRQSLADAENAKGILQSMNRQVIYFQSEHDITDPILTYLNKVYKQAAKIPARPGARRN